MRKSMVTFTKDIETGDLLFSGRFCDYDLIRVSAVPVLPDDATAADLLEALAKLFRLADKILNPSNGV